MIKKKKINIKLKKYRKKLYSIDDIIPKDEQTFKKYKLKKRLKELRTFLLCHNDNTKSTDALDRGFFYGLLTAWTIMAVKDINGFTKASDKMRLNRVQKMKD